MRTASHECHGIFVHEFEGDTISGIYPDGPNLLAFWFQFLGVQRRIERVVPEQALLFLCFLLDFNGQELIAPFEFIGYNDLPHGI